MVPPRRRSRRLEYMGAMAAGLAHEVKNPLSTMSVNLQLMAEECKDPKTPQDERMLKRAELMLGEIGRLDGIVNEFLNLARGYEFNLESVDLELLINEVLRFTEEENRSFSVDVKASFDADARWVLADPKYLRLAVNNLLVNARQAMEGEGGDLIVETRARGREAEVRVTDTGPGISKEKLDKIFMPFWSTKQGGTGIGLPAARRIVEELGGEIRVQSAVGRGTRFIFTVPLVPPALSDGSEEV